MALGGNDMEKGCSDLEDDCGIKWRANAKRVIIMITDEDSDLPTNP
jgi:hypothetical protein